MKRLALALLLLIVIASGIVLLTRPGAEADPATFTVDSTGDGGDSNTADGVCDDGSGNCTLRAAIELANAIVRSVAALASSLANPRGSG